MLRQIILLFFLFLSFNSLSQNVKKALKLYERGDSVKVREFLKKMDEKGENNPGKSFIYSLIYLNNFNDRKLLDSSFLYIKESRKNFSSIDDKVSLELKELKINLLRIDSVEDVIDSLEYLFVIKENTVESFTKYMADHPKSLYFENARKEWHSLEFQYIKKINTWKAYKKYMDTFPNSFEYSIAKKNYERLIFEDLTSEKSQRSYEIFLKNYPETPYRDSIEDIIFKFFTLENKVENYYSFLKEYPNSKSSKTALRYLYHISGRDISIINKTNIESEVVDSLRNISKVDKIPLIGIYDNSRTSFVNLSGEKIIDGGELKFIENIFCEYSKDDFFIILKENKKEVINRNFDKIYEGKFEILEDIGAGILKIFSEGGKLTLIHKTSDIILEGNYDDAYLFNNNLIIVEKDEKFALFTIRGKKIYDFIFKDIYSEGPFLVIENINDNKMHITNSKELLDNVRNLNYKIEFTCDDYEYFEEGMIIFINENEYLINDNLDTLILENSRNIQKIDIGWSYESDYGIKILSDRISFDFSTFFDNIVESPLYFSGKSDGAWDVFSIEDGTKVLEEIDSISILSDSIFWYKKERRESIFFQEGKEIDLDRSFNIRVMKPKFSDKSYIKISSDNEDHIFTSEGDTLPPAEYYYTVQAGNTISFLSKNFGISQSEILKLNNKKNKNLYIGEKLKIRGFVPEEILTESLFLINDGNKKGIIDKSGKIVLEPEYDGIIISNNTDIILIKDEKFGNYNISSNKIIKPKYKSILNPIGDNTYLVYDNNYGLVDKEGNILLPIEYNNIEFFSDSTVLVEKESNFKIIDVYSQNLYHEFKSYKTLLNDNNKFIEVFTNTGKGIISNIYGMILKPNYDQIKVIDHDGVIFFNAIKEIKEAQLLVNLIIDKKGNIIVNQGINLHQNFGFNCFFDLKNINLN
tara:strand:+ start:6120 stop:8888 length:2769 start_codon:yes stop_codon:yes gene_type:complete